MKSMMSRSRWGADNTQEEQMHGDGDADRSTTGMWRWTEIRRVTRAVAEKRDCNVRGSDVQKISLFNHFIVSIFLLYSVSFLEYR